MSNFSHFEYLQFANVLADASGAILRGYFKNPINSEQKSDQSPVTEADIEVEGRLRLLIEEKFPEHGIIGEELSPKNPNSPYQWVIDPIDGTKSFIAGYPIFTTLIALLEHGKPIVGVINQPILHERWYAAKGGKTLYNNSPLPILDNKATLEKAIISTTSTAYFTAQQEAHFYKLKTSSQNCIWGGDGYAYAMLASGRIDIVVDAGMKPYDFCALAPIIEGVGGIITDWQGKPLSLESNGTVLACNNKSLHEKSIELLRQ